jgi:serine/threonine protein kinase
MVATTELTAAGSSLGTPSYMAPEQFRAEPVAPRTDLYALGCVLYELLTGAQPFDGGGNPHALMHQHLNQPPPAPRSRRPDVPEPLDRLVLDLLAKNPAERPPSADAVAAFLRSPATAAQATVAQTRYTAKNLGGGVPDLADTANDTQGVLQDRRTMLSTLVSGDFPKCEDTRRTTANSRRVPPTRPARCSSSPPATR